MIFTFRLALQTSTWHLRRVQQGRATMASPKLEGMRAGYSELKCRILGGADP